jgi:hypothetical protein
MLDFLQHTFTIFVGVILVVGPIVLFMSLMSYLADRFWWPDWVVGLSYGVFVLFYISVLTYLPKLAS